MAIAMAPVTAEPTTDEAMTRKGSAAAKGIAPSEMKEAPRSQAALPFSRSGSVKSLGGRWRPAPWASEPLPAGP